MMVPVPGFRVSGPGMLPVPGSRGLTRFQVSGVRYHMLDGSFHLVLERAVPLYQTLVTAPPP